MTDAWERAAVNPLFRADLPLPTDGDYESRLSAHLQALEKAFSGLISGPAFVERAKQLHRAYPVTRHTYDLSPNASPNLSPRSEIEGMRVREDGPHPRRKARSGSREPR